MSNTRKIKASDKGATVLLQAMARTYAADGTLHAADWLHESTFTVLGIRPTAIDGRWGADEHTVTLVRTDVKVVKPVIVKQPKAPKVVKVGLDLCHDKSETNPFGKVTQAIAIERMSAWIAANAKRGASATDAEMVAIWLASGQKIAVAMRDLRTQAAANFAAADAARDQAIEAARVTKLAEAQAQAAKQLAALQAKVSAAVEAAKAKVKTVEAKAITKAAVAKVAQARKGQRSLKAA